jgi:membrane protein YdbS with pleckstrin-like domain
MTLFPLGILSVLILWFIPAPFLLLTLRFLGLIYVVLAATFLFPPFYWRFTQAYEINSQEVKIRAGLFSPALEVVPRANMASVVASKPFPLRLFRVGSIALFTNDGNQRILHNLPEPEAVVTAMLAAKEV